MGSLKRSIKKEEVMGKWTDEVEKTGEDNVKIIGVESLKGNASGKNAK